ncbi:MAG: hypothetical protein LC664_07135 [Flavobacteriales bacterium]|nr:hypothetical protein [Flavobacteriales bacterium]
MYISNVLQKAGFFFILLFSFGCTKVVEDLESPVLTGFSITQQPLSPGENLTVSVSATDNEEFGQVRVRIREAFSKSFGAWRVTRIEDISGATVNRNFAFAVPDSALAGYYEVSAQVSDNRGNGSVDSSLFFTILQEGVQPTITNFQTSPALGGDNSLNLNFNDTLTFSGTVSDTEGLSEVEIALQTATGSSVDNLNYALGDTIQLWEFEQFADTLIANYKQNQPSKLLIKATNSQGHLTRQVYPVNYTP